MWQCWAAGEPGRSWGEEEQSLAGMGDQGPRALIALSGPEEPPGTVTLPMLRHPYKLSAGLRETCSLHSASAKMSLPASRVLEDRDLEANHLFESMKVFSAHLLFFL